MAAVVMTSLPKRLARSAIQGASCSTRSSGIGRGRPVTFLTPRVSQFSFFRIARMISAMPRVAMAR